MSTTAFPEIKQAIDQTAAAFDEFRKTNVQRVDELRERVEELESRQKQPGRARGESELKISEEGDTWRTADGKVMPVLRKGMSFADHYPRNEDGLTLGDFIRAVSGMKTSPAATKALSVGTNTAGGYAVPTVLMPGILSAMVPASTLLQAGAGIIDVSQTEAKKFDFAGIDTIPTAAWRSEAGPVAESEPAFRIVETTPRSLAFFFKLSRELLADAPNINAALQQVIAQSFARELDRTGLRGSGSAPEPRGILGTTGVNTVTNGANGASLATTAYANFMSAVQLILEDDAPMPSAAIMSPRSLVVLGGLLDTTNQPRARPDILRDMQFLATSQVPNNLTVGSSTDCSEVYTGDFTRVSMVMREAPSIQMLSEVYAGTGQIAFLGHVRADVAILHPRALATITGVRP